MSRDAEMQERARKMIDEWRMDPLFGNAVPTLDTRVADFARSEIRRELESLRERMPWNADMCAEIDRRLAALGGTEKGASMHLAGRVLERREPGSIPGDTCEAGDRDADSGETKARAVPGAHGAEESAIDRDAPAPGATDPRLADAEALERAADVMERNSMSSYGRADALREDAAKLRAEASAPARDWADEVADVSVGMSHHKVAPYLRARFGPLVELAETCTQLMGTELSRDARAALRALLGGGA